MTDQQCWDSLEKNFGLEGSANSEMRWLESCESSVPNEILARGFRGRVLMLRSFQSFFVESLDCAIRLVKEGGWPETEFYAEILTLLFTSLRRFRACFILFERGIRLMVWLIFGMSKIELSFCVLWPGTGLRCPRH